MVVSAARLEANRRNAQKSTGPRTEEGKKRSSQNAVTHGLRAETLVLFDEDPQVLEDRREAWRACLLPGDDVEERLVDDAVVYTWQQDRARRAQANRINANIINFGVDQGQTNEKEVVDLGRRLFKDRLGPLVFYPSPSMGDRYDFSRVPSTSFAGKREEDPDRPAELVLCLQSTLLGCEWMLGEWAKLKAILDEGQPWLSSDKLKAVRLLGKQLFDAIDERDVAMVFLASFVLKPDKDSWHWEIAMELSGKDIKRFRNSAAARELESLKPEDAAKAREALRGIIERATERLTKKAEAHQERARVMAALAPDILAFDDSPDGERLRRFDLASGRGLARSLGELRRHRHSAGQSSVVSSPLSVVSGPLSVVSDPLSVAGCEAEALTEANATNEPNDPCENVTNEPVRGPLSVVRCQLPVVSCAVEGVDERNATNEPNDVCENVTNEPNDACESVTNEPTCGPLSVVSGPLSVAGCEAEAITEANATNEPNEVQENVTNEPTDAQQNATNEANDPCENMMNEPTAARENVMNELVSGPLSVVRCPLPVVKRKPIRAERLLELNEEARRKAEQAMAARRARLREQRNKNGKPAGQPKGRETRTGQRKKKENAARQKSEVDESVTVVHGLYEKAPPAPSYSSRGQ